MRKKTFREKTRLAFTEVRMVVSTALGLFAGRKVWMPDEAAPETEWVDECPKRNLALARSSYDERLKSESAGIEAVRRRAEFALTAIIAAIGLSTAAFERLWAVATSSTSLLVIWLVGVLIVVMAVLVFAGVAVSNKVLGAVQVEVSFTFVIPAERSFDSTLWQCIRRRGLAERWSRSSVTAS